MSATTLPLVAAMLLTAAIEIAVACSVWMRVDDECCGCWLFDAVVMGCRGCCCVLCWLREGLCLMLVAAGMVGLLFTWQLAEAICRLWSFLWLGARTCMLKMYGECC
jgi:hypothetical protein